MSLQPPSHHHPVVVNSPANANVNRSGKRRRASRLASACTDSSLDPSASAALLDDEQAHLLSPSTSDHAKSQLNALIYPEDRYSTSRTPIKAFYNSQNEFVDSLKKLVLLNDKEDIDEKPSTAAYLAIQISLALTFVLLGLKLFSAIYSGSIAVLASAVLTRCTWSGANSLRIPEDITQRRGSATERLPSPQAVDDGRRDASDGRKLRG